jgi:hypothetical protein
MNKKETQNKQQVFYCYSNYNMFNLLILELQKNLGHEN